MTIIKRGKISKPPAPELVEYLFRPAIETDLQRSYQTIVDINRAHVIMLEEEGIIKKEVASKILKVTQEISQMQSKPKFEITPDVEDLYFNMERYLIKKTGIDVGGQQHTGRSRNDMIATLARIDSRTYYFKLCVLLNELRNSLLAFAETNTKTVFSGYTHLQPSEPITMAHYCSAILNALERDYTRISNAFYSLNICPLGGCAMASTSFPINRETTAALLGFNKPVPNSIDCVASRDYVIEIISGFSIMANNLSRLAQDLYIWSTPEFNYVEVDDSVAACSSIMPQKKNPITLEHIKSKAAHLEAFYISVFSALKNTPYTHARDISCESIKYYWSALQEVEAILKLSIVTVKTLKVKKEEMLKKAQENFCSVTELANYFVRYDGISFRAAHEIVANIVNYMIVNNKRSDEIDKEIINKSYEKLFQKQTNLTNEQIMNALNPLLNVSGKKTEGGSNPAEVKQQLAQIKKQLKRDEKSLTKRIDYVNLAKSSLDKKTNELIKM